MNRLRRLVASGVVAAALSSVAAPTSPAWAAATRASSPPAHHAASSSSAGRDAGEVIGFVGLVGLLVAWTEGYGLLGGRIRRRPGGPRDQGPASDDA